MWKMWEKGFLDLLEILARLIRKNSDSVCLDWSWPSSDWMTGSLSYCTALHCSSDVSKRGRVV